MALSNEQIEGVIERLKSVDVQTRLVAINEAYTLHSQLFPPGQDLADYARAVFITETLYNLTRDNLRKAYVKLVVPEGAAETLATEKSKAVKATPAKTKAKKSGPPVSLVGDFAAFLKAKGSDEKTNA